MDDKIFDKVEKKTKINKDTIIRLANDLQNNGLKDESTIRNIIRELSNMTGKKVSDESETKIVETIIKDKVPKGVEKMF